MQLTINPFGEWRRVATVEVSSRVMDLPTLVRDDTLKFRLVEADSLRRNIRRFDLVVDSSEGERRCARTAWAVLSAMQEAARHGCIDKYQVIEGNQWLLASPTSARTSSGTENAIALTKKALKKTSRLLHESGELLERIGGLVPSCRLDALRGREEWPQSDPHT